MYVVVEINQKLKIRIKSISSHPLKLNLTERNKIYTKYFLYLLGLMEFNSNNKISITTTKTFCLKKKINNLQVLRAPNRHKKAQFHVVKNKFYIYNTYVLRWKSTQINPSLILIFLTKFLNNFESNTIFTKNFKYLLNTKLVLNKIYNAQFY